MSDAGTPCISDPGARLISRARSAGARIEAIPGPSAITTALSIAGLDANEFTFLGFLPHKKGRQTALKKLTESEISVVLYESPHRLLKLLNEFVQHQVLHITVARELTKIHEEIVSGTPSELLAHFAEHPDTVRGEVVVIIEAKRR